MTDRYKSSASTHADGCWDWGHRHYECAVEKIKRLQAEVEQLRADLLESEEIRENLRHLLKRIATALKGEPPDGVWHSWHDLPEKATQLKERVHLNMSFHTDAERYRWLRDKADSITVCTYTSDGEWIPLHPENIDSTIDAAMKADRD